MGGREGEGEGMPSLTLPVVSSLFPLVLVCRWPPPFSPTYAHCGSSPTCTGREEGEEGGRVREEGWDGREGRGERERREGWMEGGGRRKGRSREGIEGWDGGDGKGGGWRR